MPGRRPAHRHSLGPELGPDERRFVHAIALKYVRDPDAAEDVTQDALLLAHRHRAGFRGDCRYSTWLYRVAATAALMHLRRQRRIHRGEQRLDDDERPAEVRADAADLGPGPEQVCAAREGVERVAEAVAALGEKYREVFWMRFVDDLSDGEVAAALGVGLPTIKTRTHRVRQMLRDGLDQAA